MLALPRIAAAESGPGTPRRASLAGKAAGATNNPFSKMLAGLRSARSAGPDAARGKLVAPEAAAPAKGARAIIGRRLSSKTDTPGARETGPRHPLQVNDTAAKASAKPAATTSSSPKPSSRAGGDEKARKGGAPSESIDAALVAATAGSAASKPTPRPDDAAPTVRANKGSDGDSGLERLGVREETGKGGAKVTVVDMRLKAASDVSNRRGAAKARPEGESGDDAARDGVSANKAETEPRVFAGRVPARVDEGSQAGAPRETSPAAPQASADSLASRLRDGAADIVRSAQIVLRDGDSGVIRLRLEPESLGGVKIELKMTEKQISGRIVVESDIAGDAFRSSIDALRDAFAECGFETTALEVEVRNGMASGAGGERGDGAGRDDGDGPYWSRSLRELDAAVPRLATAGRDGLLDVIV